MTDIDPERLLAAHPGAIIRPFAGQWPRIDPTAYVAPGAVVVGDVTIGPEANIWYACVLRGDDSRIVVGARSNVQDGTIIHVFNDDRRELPTIIGANVTVGHAAKLHGCTVGDSALVGIGAIVLDGAEMKPQSMLAAGSVLAPGKVMQSRELWVGNPARMKRSLSDEEAGYLAWNADHYVALAAGHR